MVLFTNYGQEIPSWIKYGLTINEIKNILGVDRNGISARTDNEVGAGVFMPRPEKQNLYYYVTDNEISYQFDIDPKNGLTNLVIASKYNVLDLIRNLTYKYGSPHFDDDKIFWSRENRNDLPRYIEVIVIVNYEDGNFANVFYFLRK
jgi:hypothetical protein